MWRTSKGDRVLKGAEAELFRAAAGSLLEYACNCHDESACTGHAAFDRLTWHQQISALAFVCHALLRPEIPVPQHTASNEAAIATVFGHIEVLLDEDEGTDEPGETEAESMIQSAARETGIIARYVEMGSDEEEITSDYQCLIQALTDRVLWDDDYSDNEISDLPPETIQIGKQMLGIADEYYTAVPDDPSEGETKTLIKQLWVLLDGE